MFRRGRNRKGGGDGFHPIPWPPYIHVCTPLPCAQVASFSQKWAFWQTCLPASSSQRSVEHDPVHTALNPYRDTWHGPILCWPGLVFTEKLWTMWLCSHSGHGACHTSLLCAWYARGKFSPCLWSWGGGTMGLTYRQTGLCMTGNHTWKIKIKGTWWIWRVENQHRGLYTC